MQKYYGLCSAEAGIYLHFILAFESNYFPKYGYQNKNMKHLWESPNLNPHYL